MTKFECRYCEKHIGKEIKEYLVAFIEGKEVWRCHMECFDERRK